MKNEIEKMDVDGEHLFDRVVSILEQARGNVVRAVNSNMVLAYWLIGREIVEEIQGGEERAEYGKQVVAELSKQLTKKYGKGFSPPVLWSFRQFYQVYAARLEILFPTGRELKSESKLFPSGRESANSEKRRPLGDELESGFNPKLTWSHYRALMRVKDEKARDFYEQESVECGWNKVQLERQIRTSYFERIIANDGEAGLLPAGRERLPGERVNPVHILKSPTTLRREISQSFTHGRGVEVRN